MVHRWASFALGVIACVLLAAPASSQSAEQSSDRSRWRGALGKNEPNPFSEQTTIPFTIGSAECSAGSEHHTVTLRIYNILSQIVGVAMLVEGANGDTASGPAKGRRLSNLDLACGNYVARWDGKHVEAGRDSAAPGVYMYQLVIDGRPAGMRRMLLKR
jgi:hypothetical protein